MYISYIHIIERCTPTNTRHTCARTSIGRARRYTLARRAAQGVGLPVAALEHVVPHAYITKISHKPLTYIQQTVNILTIEHVYRYATLLLGVRVCLGGMRIDT